MSDPLPSLETSQDAPPSIEIGYAVKAPKAGPAVRASKWTEWDGGQLGGRPFWLSPKNLPEPEEFLCGRCAKPLLLLTQVYAPLDGQTDAFHRSLYVLCCASSKCLNASGRASGAVRAWRCQLPRENPFLPVEGDTLITPPPAEREDGLCYLCGCPARQRCANCKGPRYCSKAHQGIHWKHGHKNLCGAGGDGYLESRGLVERNRDKKAALLGGALLPEWDIEIEEEPSKSEMAAQTEKSLPAEATRALKEMREREAAEAVAAATAATDGGGSSISSGGGAAVLVASADVATTGDLEGSIDDLTQKDLGEATGSSNVVDTTLTSFLTRVDIAPTQVLRYCRWPATATVSESESTAATKKEDDDDEADADTEGAPLWFSREHQPASSDITPCGRCGAPRAFELQIMPQALHYVLPGGPASVTAEDDAVDMDFGTIVLFTCTRSCAVDGGGYAEELVWVQPAAEKSLAEKERMEEATAPKLPLVPSSTS